MTEAPVVPPLRLDEAARRYLGVRFVHQGRNPANGIDCIGLGLLAGRDCARPWASSDYRKYPKNPCHGLLRRYLLEALGEPAPMSELRAGDVVSILYYEHRKRSERHLAIVGEHRQGLSLIHTNAAVGEVTEAILDAKWRSRIVGVWHG